MYLHVYVHMCVYGVFLGPIGPLRVFLFSWLEMLPKCLVVEGVELYLADYYHIHLKSLGRKLGPVLRFAQKALYKCKRGFLGLRQVLV